MEANTLSMRQALDALEELRQSKEIDANSLGFIATVFRDNELDQDLHDFFDFVQNYIAEKEDAPWKRT